MFPTLTPDRIRRRRALLVERMMLVYPAYLAGLILPRNLAPLPLSTVYKWKARRSLERMRVWDKPTQARKLADAHHRAADGCKPAGASKLLQMQYEAHSHVAQYCQNLFPGDKAQL